MPELPEVETIRKDLQRRIVNKKISKVEILRGKIVQGQNRNFKKTIEGNAIQNVKRRGKLLVLQLKTSEQFLLIHLKMTGQLIYQSGDKIVAGGHNVPKTDELPGKYTRVWFQFTDGSQLFFNDLRMFGYLRLVDDEDLKKVLDKFGIEPLTKGFTLSKFTDILKNRQKSIKAVLLDQGLIAGIGNIYADEACFRAGIRPSRRASRLTIKEIKKLFNACNYIIKKAIKYRGTSSSDYVDASGRKGGFFPLLKVYQRGGQKCKKCRTTVIKKTRLAGRGTHHCSNCQK